VEAAIYTVCPMEAFDRASFRAPASGQHVFIYQEISYTDKVYQVLPVYFPWAEAYFAHNCTLHGRLDAFTHEVESEDPALREDYAERNLGEEDHLEDVATE
jgi:hypothetical protein